ncbi:tail assembly chaperone [Mycobacterium phage Mendokysei]|uniref:Tail assembly chaperone n=1 Tax=Mycobacterium phage Mendokysei TaxID=2099637 RepID=A0A2P1CGA1_9CAUD|nr:tail assembly chaperone [Mycobacterium phage Mendokysei]AVJ50281.1 tail assembly chaperone [Mycobacterium phage Mendokysei]
MAAGFFVAPPNRKASNAMTSRRRNLDLGQLSPRLLELSAKTNPVPPYQVTDKIQIRQTRHRRDELAESWTQMAMCQAKLRNILKEVSTPAPEAPGEDATEEQRAQYEAELAAWTAKMQSLEVQSAEIREKSEAATERYNRAFFGSEYDAIMELTADWDAELFDAFVADVNAHFLQGVNPPPDGTDEAGEVVDADEAGKAP